MPSTIQSIELRNLQIEDYKELKKSMNESYPEMAESFWKEPQIEILLEKFPEGQLVIVVDGIVVGSALSILVTEDFAFPSNGIKAEATPNTEMTLIVDVDINLLKELHEHGSVNTMKDRRHDLYQLKKVK